MLVDIHNHVMPSESLELWKGDSVFGVEISGEHWSGTHHVSFDISPSFYDPAARLAELDSRGIGGAVVSPPPAMFCYQVSGEASAALCDSANEGMRRYCEAAPERFRWLANLPLQDPARAVATLVGAKEMGCVGAAVGTSIAGKRLDEEPYEEFWATAARLRLPVLVHPSFNEPHAALERYYLQNVIGNPLETTVFAERMICAGVLEKNPELRLVLLHGGGFFPYQLGRLRHARGVRPELAGSPEDPLHFLPQLFFDTITHDDQALEYLVQRMGEAQVLLGTDLPFDMAMREPTTTLRRVLGEQASEVVGSKNAARLFGLGR